MEASEFDALIVSNIGDLEKAFARVKEKIDRKLNSEAWDTLKQALHDAEYHFDDGDDPDAAWFAPRSWLDEDDDSDTWFRLSARDHSALETWLACYVAPSSEREAMGIQWHNNFYVRKYKPIFEAHLEELHQIEDAGFRRDGNDIYLPISFDIAKLAEGFREGDLTEALSPISRAAEAMEKARPSFQRLRDAIIASAKG